ncbi:TPA: hypothetical protein ACXJLS_000403 [Stenotrophomonas maltophilia]
MSKEKFDLSNVGGQPKDWMQREHEKQIESRGWRDYWIPVALIGLPVLLLICAGIVGYRFL